MFLAILMIMRIKKIKIKIWKNKGKTYFVREIEFLQYSNTILTKNLADDYYC